MNNKMLRSIDDCCDDANFDLSMCAGIPDALRTLLVDDPSVVVGLCLRPAFLSAAGRKAVARLLEQHARHDGGARAVREWMLRDGRTMH